jgi:hypothetical protein
MFDIEAPKGLTIHRFHVNAKHRCCHAAGFVGGASTYEGESWKWRESP